ncbi:hypothetical protein KC734_02940 [candidate division KSB1 bacterium]|nr:hypothetical protein [candidate division KSB1 bacterium]
MNSSSLAEQFKLPESLKPGKIALIFGGAGLLLSAVGFFLDAKQFYHSYLAAFVFWTTIALGGLFFTMLHHLTGATWSVVLRRFSEAIMVILPVLAILFLPIIPGMHDLYHWTHEEAVAADHILQQKEPYLNIPFFLIRAVFYFGVWFLLARTLKKYSTQQDNAPEPSLTDKMRRFSAPGMLLFAVTLTYAAFDWLMSLNPHWYSTIFGVYIFSGSLLSVLAFILLAALYLRGKDVLQSVITLEHYHDLGKLLFGFTVFWAYIAFSQYMLIWYGNIPEETEFFLQRWEGSWKYVSMVIVFFHFALPFLILVTRAAKRNLALMKVMGFWFLIIHYVDIHWIVMPTLHTEGFSLSWIDFTTLIGIGGLFVWYFWKQFAQQATVPINDPKLQSSIQFTNA